MPESSRAEDAAKTDKDPENSPKKASLVMPSQGTMMQGAGKFWIWSCIMCSHVVLYSKMKHEWAIDVRHELVFPHLGTRSAYSLVLRAICKLCNKHGDFHAIFNCWDVRLWCFGLMLCYWYKKGHPAYGTPIRRGVLKTIDCDVMIIATTTIWKCFQPPHSIIAQKEARFFLFDLFCFRYCCAINRTSSSRSCYCLTTGCFPRYA